MSELMPLDGHDVVARMQHMLGYPAIQNLLGEDLAGELSVEVRDVAFPHVIPVNGSERNLLSIPATQQHTSGPAVVCIKPASQAAPQLSLAGNMCQPTARRRALMAQELITQGVPPAIVPDAITAALPEQHLMQPAAENFQIDFSHPNASLSAVTFLHGWRSDVTYTSRSCIQLNPNKLPQSWYRLATLVLRNVLVAYDIDSNPRPVCQEAEALADFRANVLEAELLRQGIARGLIGQTDTQIMKIDTLRRTHKMDPRHIFPEGGHFADSDMIGFIRLGDLMVYDLREAAQAAAQAPRKR